MADVVIREPRPDEAEALAELHLRTWEETYRGKFPESAWGDEARNERVRMWSSICSDPPVGARFAVAEREGALIGLAGAGAEDDEGRRELFFIYLLAAEQGSGAGQALLDAVLGDAPSGLWVLEDNPRARAFYMRNGFTATGERQATGFDTGGDEVRLLR